MQDSWQKRNSISVWITKKSNLERKKEEEEEEILPQITVFSLLFSHCHLMLIQWVREGLRPCTTPEVSKLPSYLYFLDQFSGGSTPHSGKKYLICLPLFQF